MPTTHPAIEASDVGTFMSHLFGLDIDAAASSAATPSPLGALATYVDDQETVRGMMVCDVAGAAILGAALTQIPVGLVKDCIKDGELAGNLRENLAEVLNIAVNVFPSHQNNRLVLREVSYLDQIEMPESDGNWNSNEFTIDVARYGSGSLQIVQCG
mgnify:CR=1 FL=1